MNRITKICNTVGSVVSYEYDRDGNVTKTVFGDGSVEECTYGAGGKVTRKETRTAAGEVLSCYEYDYDGAGNVITQRGIEPGDETKITTATMTYDAGNRLITFNGEKVLYDADGNMTYGPLDGEMTHFTYDCRNRLIRAGETTYTYDAENVRTGVKTPEYEEEYLVNTNSELSQILISERIGGAESGVTGYTYGNGLVSQYTRETGTEYYHYDNVGSTMYLTRDGRKTHEFAYGVYGELTKGAYGEVAFMYNGRYGVTTDSNGLYYMRARYYNPTIRRFINQDILTGSITDSQSLNRYAYCQGNPVNYLDPFGLSPYSLFSAFGHTILNLIGFVPGVGDVADGFNALWYLAEGNYAEAAISGICAIPAVGLVANFFGASPRVLRGIRIAGNVGKIYLGGSAGKQNLDNIHKMVVSGNGQWYDYLREGGMLTLNMLSCAMGTSGVMDDVNDIVKQYQKARTQKLADYVSQNTVIGDGFDNKTFNTDGQIPGKTDDIVSGISSGKSSGTSSSKTSYGESSGIGSKTDIPSTKSSINQGKDPFRNVYFKKPDIKMVNDAANQVGIDRKEFGNYIHEIKADFGMKANQNFTYKELVELAEEYKKMIE